MDVPFCNCNNSKSSEMVLKAAEPDAA